MSSLKRAFNQASLYTFFQGLGMAVSFITFPIITRILSVEDYGNLALVNATMSILLGVAKFGMTTSFIRFYAASKSDLEKAGLYTTALAGSLFISLLITGLYAVVLFFFGDDIGAYLTKVLLIAGALIVLGDLRDLFNSFLRAEEKVFTLSVMSLLFRIGSALSGIVACVVFLGGLFGYMIGIVLFEAVMVSGFIYFFARRGVFAANTISLSVLKTLFVFGAPLLLFEISSLLNDYSDRFLIKYFLDSASLGIYSVGYNLSLYVQAFVTSPLWMAIFPIYTKIWETDGAAKTSQFLEFLLKYYLCAAILVVSGLTVTSRELLTVLATQRYAGAAAIVPFIITSVMLYGTTHITGAGFFLQKRTRTIALLTLTCAAVNFALNLFLIPTYHIAGAAYSTFVSYCLLTLLVTSGAGKLLKIRWPWRDVAMYTLFAVIMVSIIFRFDYSNVAVNLVVKSLAGFVIYTSCVLLYDREIRVRTLSYLGHFYRNHLARR